MRPSGLFEAFLNSDLSYPKKTGIVQKLFLEVQE